MMTAFHIVSYSNLHYLWTHFIWCYNTKQTKPQNRTNFYFSVTGILY